MHLSKLEAVYSALDKELSAEIVKYSEAKYASAQADAALLTSEQLLLKYEKSVKLLQKLVEDKKQATVTKIEQLVSYGLQSVFEDDSYQFKIIDSIKRNQVDYEFIVTSDSNPSSEGVDIMDSRGGGLVNIISMLLRVIMLILTDRTAERFLVLDEPFNNLSPIYHDNLVKLLKKLVAKLNFQILMVTHQRSLLELGDVVYEYKKKNKVTSAYRLK